MVEKVARAMYEAQVGASVPEDLWAVTLAHPAFVGTLATARAAIQAMRDCTPEMLDAGSAAHPVGGYRRETLLTDIIECEWWAMVDAALECSTKPDGQ
jgi:hypothetical protein